MNIIKIVIAGLVGMSVITWQPDMETAKKLSKKTGHPILLNFSGSDWCGPCVRMEKEIFETKEFIGFADSALVLLNADFPRNRKNQLEKKHQKENDELAEKYNPEGKFPYTVLLNSEGKLLRSWEGYPEGGTSALIKDIKSVPSANR